MRDKAKIMREIAKYRAVDRTKRKGNRKMRMMANSILLHLGISLKFYLSRLIITWWFAMKIGLHINSAHQSSQKGRHSKIDARIDNWYGYNLRFFQQTFDTWGIFSNFKSFSESFRHKVQCAFWACTKDKIKCGRENRCNYD